MPNSSRNTAAPPEVQFFDNYRIKKPLADYLRENLADAAAFRIVSAYFSIYGYGALADQLDAPALKSVRFLFGDPASAADVSGVDRNRITFALGEDGLNLSISDVLRQRQLAQRCADWVKRDSTEVRTIRKDNFLHGKMYHTENAGGGGVVTIGSSNFTRRGLGKASFPNIELNIATQAPPLHSELAAWFDALWRDEEHTRDAKAELLAALLRLHKEYAPQFLYYKTLYELFYEELEARKLDEDRLSATRLGDTAIWKALYEFQKDGAKSIIARLLRHNGCILADSIGLGKTYTALAVIKFFELRNERVLVLCPKKLEHNWRVYQASGGAANNPFAADRFSYVQLAHTDLSRDSGMSGIVNLADFNWDSYDLVVIDESHNFRNQSKNRKNPETGEVEQYGRYDRLLREVISRGSKTKVLMLSATPVNTSLLDLRNQIYLITEGRDDDFADTLNIRNIKDIVKTAQHGYERWEQRPVKERRKNDLLTALGGDFLRLLSGITIARSRKQISQFYGEYIKEHGEFPKRKKPRNMFPHTDSERELSYQDVYAALEKLRFYLYKPSDYVIDERAKEQLEAEKKKFNFNQETREKYLIAMMHINFLKRLESSVEALRLTLDRTHNKITAQIDGIERYRQNEQSGQNDAAQIIGNDDDEVEDEDEDFIVSARTRHPYHLRELDVVRWRADLQKDLQAIQKIRVMLEKITPQRDGKLIALGKQISRKINKNRNRKLLVFTSFKDTAVYLYEHIAPQAEALGIRAALVAGDTTKTQGDRNNYTDILDSFSPRARKSVGQREIDLIIATDCISEGQNLQDCDTVLNYDIHWNPVRIIQRFGRIDRIGSRNKSVRMTNFWPLEDMDAYLALRKRVQSRMALVDLSGTGDDDVLSPEDREERARASKGFVQGRINFRDECARKIRNEVIDLEALSDNVSMSDLTLDYFLMQLMHYLRQHEQALKDAPSGIYAVTYGKALSQSGVEKLDTPAAIFCFRQKRSADKPADNPVHPYYLVHVNKDGVVHRHSQAGEILALYSRLALPHDKPIAALCDKFTRTIKTAAGKQQYDRLARDAVADIETTSHDNAVDGLENNPLAVIPPEDAAPQADNLELITWLVIP